MATLMATCIGLPSLLVHFQLKCFPCTREVEMQVSNRKKSKRVRLCCFIPIRFARYVLLGDFYSSHSKHFQENAICTKREKS